MSSEQSGQGIKKFNTLLAQLREEVRAAKEDLVEENEVYEPPDCHYCDRQMEVGSIGGGEIRFGCYRDDCDIKEEESKWATYSITRTTASASAARGRYRGLVQFAHRVARREYDAE